jgi:hypothetical protein
VASRPILCFSRSVAEPCKTYLITFRMASSEQDDFNYDTDDIQDADSDWLHEHRPNRWRGAASTWKGFNEYDRYGAESLDLLRNQDLSVHLYNAFNVKRDGIPVTQVSDLDNVISCFSRVLYRL